MKITNDQIEERMSSGEIDSDPYIQWAQINKQLIKFERKANIDVFRKLFDGDSKRLYSHFWDDCNCKFQQFLTYLTQEQKNELIVNAVENQTWLYS